MKNCIRCFIAEQKRPIILAVSTITIALLVVIGIIIYLTVDNAKNILFAFLAIIIAIGIAMIIYTEIQRRKAIQRKNKGWIKSTVEVQSRRPKASAPPISQRASWALIPRKWSTGTMLPAYAPAQPSAPTIYE